MIGGRSLLAIWYTMDKQEPSMPQAFDTFASASSALSTYQVVDVSGTPSVRTGAQFLRLFGVATGTAADTVTVELALIKAGVRIASFYATGTLLAITDGTKNVITFAFDEGSSSKFDLLGCDRYTVDQVSGTTAPDNKAFWMIGVSALSGASDVDLYAAVSGAI